MELLYGALERTLAPLLRLWVDWDIDGASRLPKRGPLVVACNHVSYFDPLAVAYALHGAGLRARFLAKAELFQNPLAGFALRRLGQIPVRRGGGDASALEAAEAALWRGGVVVVFPEGTIGPGLPLLPFKSGAARLSIATGLPVLPVATWGGQAMLPKGAPPDLRRGHRVRVVVGDPIRPPAAIATPERVQELTSELATRIGELVAKIAGDGPC